MLTITDPPPQAAAAQQNGGVTALHQEPCQSRCDWMPTGEEFDGELVFACSSCTSQWTRQEGWAPRNLDGSIALAVQAEPGRV